MVRLKPLQAHLSAMREKRLSNIDHQADDGNGEAMEEEEASEIDTAAAARKYEPINPTDPFTPDHIADVFQLCKSACGLENLSCLLYMTLRYVGMSWDDSDNFLTTVGAYTSMWFL